MVRIRVATFSIISLAPDERMAARVCKIPINLKRDDDVCLVAETDSIKDTSNLSTKGASSRAHISDLEISFANKMQAPSLSLLETDRNFSPNLMIEGMKDS